MFGGLEVSDAKKLRALKQENQKLKRLLAEAEFDKASLKEWSVENANGHALRPVQSNGVLRSVDRVTHFVTRCVKARIGASIGSNRGGVSRRVYSGTS